MNDIFTISLKHEFPDVYEHNEQQKIILKKYQFWTPQDWRKHYNAQKINKFRILPKCLFYSELFANLKPTAQTTLIFALGELHFEHKEPDKRHNSNRKKPAYIISNFITIPIAALQAIGVGSKNTCIKAIDILIQNEILVKHPRTNIGKPNTFSFTTSFINNFICI